MLVLALDTTTRAGSCALARDGVVLQQAAGDPARPHDARLPGDIARLLDHTGFTLDDIDIYVVGTGPGSFTGLRVGIAAMQGLAFAAGRPLIGVSALDALEALARPQCSAATTAGSARTDRDVGSGRCLIATWVDAWRGEVFAALYADGREVEAPTVEPPATILERLRDRSTWFIGDGVAAHRVLIEATLGPLARLAEPASPLIAGALAVLGTDAARAGAHPPPHAIRPQYVRRPDAELARHARDSR